MSVPSTQPLCEVKLAAYTSGSRAFSPVAIAMLCMAKTSSVSPQPMMNCWKRVNGANHGATAADMSTCRRLITNVVKTMEKTDAPIPHRPTAMNCPAPT